MVLFFFQNKFVCLSIQISQLKLKLRLTEKQLNDSQDQLRSINRTLTSEKNALFLHSKDEN